MPQNSVKKLPLWVYSYTQAHMHCTIFHRYLIEEYISNIVGVGELQANMLKSISMPYFSRVTFDNIYFKNIKFEFLSASSVFVPLVLGLVIFFVWLNRSFCFPLTDDPDVYGTHRTIKTAAGSWKQSVRGWRHRQKVGVVKISIFIY